MDHNRSSRILVNRMVLLAFFIVALATGDGLGGIFVFFGLCVAFLFFYPVLIVIRGLTARLGVVSAWKRQALMMALPLGFAAWVFSFTNCFGGYQRQLLAHGMLSVPANTKILHYTGYSGIHGERCIMTIVCSAKSLRTILSNPEFSIREDSHGLPRPDELDLPFAPGSKVMTFVRSLGSMSCNVMTDETYRWAYVSYVAGD